MPHFILNGIISNLDQRVRCPQAWEGDCDEYECRHYEVHYFRGSCDIFNCEKEPTCPCPACVASQIDEVFPFIRKEEVML